MWKLQAPGSLLCVKERNLFEVFLEFVASCLIEVISRHATLALSKPLLYIRILGEVEASNFIRWYSCSQGDVSNGHVVSNGPFLTTQEGVEEFHCLLHFLEVLGVSGSLGEQLWVPVVGKTLIKCAHVKVQALMDLSTLLHILWVQRIILAVFLDQVKLNCTGFPQSESVVVDGGDRVLRIDLERREIT